VKIDSWRHPFREVQDRLQDYDRNLWLVFSQRRQRWMVVLESEHSVPTHPWLVGMEGCCSERCRYEVGAIVQKADGSYLSPRDAGSLILACVAKNDQRRYPVMGRIAADDAAIERRRERARAEVSDKARDAAAEAMKVASGRVLCTDAGRVDYVKLGDKSEARSG